MATPSKLTIEQIRNRAVASLDRLEIAALKKLGTGETKTSDSTTLESKAANRHRGALEWAVEQGTTQAQRERYPSQVDTFGKWHDQFVMLHRELPWMEGAKITTTAILKEFGTTPLFRFQRAFSYYHSIIAPRELIKEYLGDASDIKAWREKFSKCSLKGALVSPDLISNRLVQQLGLLEWPEKVKPLDAIEMKNTPKVIDGLKLIFEASTRFNPRISRLTSPSPALKLRYPAASTVSPALEGTFIYWRGDDSTQPRPYSQQKATRENPPVLHRETPGFFDSVYTLLRATMHKDIGYTKEIVSLGALEQTAQDLVTRINQDWRRETSKETREVMRKEIERFSEEATPALSNMKHLAKQEAGELLEGVKTILAKDPVNPDTVVSNIGALLTKIAAIRRRFFERGDDIPAKSKWNTVDKQELEQYIAAQEKVFKDLYRSLNDAPQIITQHARLFDKSTPLSSTERDKHSAELLKALNLTHERLASISARPLITFAKTMRPVMTDLERAITTGNKIATEEAVVKLVILAKLALTNACIERLKRFTSYCNVPFDSFESIATDLFEILAKREVYPARSVTAYQDVYSKLQRGFKGMARRFKELQGSTLSDNDRLEKYTQIKRFLETPTYNIEKAFADLAGISLIP